MLQTWLQGVVFTKQKIWEIVRIKVLKDDRKLIIEVKGFSATNYSS